MNPAGPSKNEEFPQPLDPRFQRPYKFSPEETRVLAECNKESFYQRCLPLGTLFGVGTYLGVQNGYLRANARWGAVPKVMVSVIIGYFLGKFSYQGRCAEKLMQLPNSQIGELLRKRRKGTFQESLDPSFGPGMSLAPFSGMGSSETYSDVGPNSFDMDTSRPQIEGLDDSHRPSMDNPIYEEEMPPVQKHTTTYEELRKQNREEHQQKRTMNYREPLRSTAPPPTSSQEPSPKPGIRNKYGDAME